MSIWKQGFWLPGRPGTATAKHIFDSRLVTAALVMLCVMLLLVNSVSPTKRVTAFPALGPVGTAGSAGGTGASFNVTWSQTCETPPTAAVTALDYAAGVWSGLISSTVPIEASACWTSVLDCSGDALACGGPTGLLRNFPNAPLVDTF